MPDPEQKPTEAENPASEEKELEIDFGEDNEPAPEPPPKEKIETPESTEDSQESETFIDQEAVNKRINKITFEKHEERRKREQLQEEFEALKARWEEKSKKEEDIEIPPVPDVYDDDYEKKLKERDDIIQQIADRKAEKKWQKKQEETRNAKQFEELQKKTLAQIQAMHEKATEYGIKKEELEKADETVGKFIKSPELARFLLGQKEAPLIMKYLSSDAVELENISKMDPLEASAYIATEINKKALKLKPGITKTPDPVDIPKGKSSFENDPYLKGVTFE